MSSTLLPDLIESIHDEVLMNYNRQLCYCQGCTGSPYADMSGLYTKGIQMEVENINRDLKITIIITPS